MNIFLVGYRCTGKTTVGKQMAARIGWRFVDADAELVADAGMSVAELVSQKGWRYFRQLEARVLKRLCQNERQVIATGGGVVLDPENVRRMKNNGVVVWLRATPENIYHRMCRDPNSEGLRPALTDKKLWDEITETLSTREPLYKSAMSGLVDTDQKTVDTVCREVLSILADNGYQL